MGGSEVDGEAGEAVGGVGGEREAEAMAAQHFVDKHKPEPLAVGFGGIEGEEEMACHLG